MAELKVSADGLFYWDGARWISALSPDGRSRWNGTEWVPLPTGPAVTYYQGQRSPRVATRWTKPLQSLVAVWYVICALIQLVNAAITPMKRQAVIDSLNQGTASGQPFPFDPNAFANTMVGFTIAIYVAIAALNVVLAVGALRRWTWVFWTAIGLNAFGVIALLADVVNTGNQSATEPAWLLAVLISSHAIAIAIASILLVAGLTRGPWAAPKVAPW
jgi:hypothetical protein